MDEENPPLLASKWDIILGVGAVFLGGAFVALALLTGPYPREHGCEGWQLMLVMVSLGIALLTCGIVVAAPGARQRGRVAWLATGIILGVLGCMWILTYLAGAIPIIFSDCGSTENLMNSVAGGFLLVWPAGMIFWYPSQ